MTFRQITRAILVVAGLPVFSVGVASAADIVQTEDAFRVPRVKPASPTKQYPFGVLREDYTPYGMAGVPDRLYFDRIERAPHGRRRHVVSARY